MNLIYSVRTILEYLERKVNQQPSDKHSDLYTDENPRGTIHGLGFKDVETARASVKKIENSDRTHAHKIQILTIAMEQRARVMGKKVARILQSIVHTLRR